MDDFVVLPQETLHVTMGDTLEVEGYDLDAQEIAYWLTGELNLASMVALSLRDIWANPKYKIALEGPDLNPSWDMTKRIWKYIASPTRDLNVRRGMIAEIANSRYLSPWTLRYIYKCDPQLLAESTGHYGILPRDLVVSMAESIDSNLRAAIATNTNTPADLLIALAADEDDYVVTLTASNSSLPQEAIEIIIKHDSAMVLRTLSYNPALLPRHRHKLMNDSRLLLEDKKHLATDFPLSKKTQNQILKGERELRMALAISRFCPQNIWEELMIDDDEGVRQAARLSDHARGGLER